MNELKNNLKVAMLTTWRVKCGVASYSENLARALSKNGVDVYIVRIPRFGRKSSDVFNNVVGSVPVDKVDLIHVQNEYGLIQHLEPQLYQGLKALGKPIVSTMHAVGMWMNDRVVNEYSDRIIVHNEFCFKRFKFHEKLGVIPHGATVQTTPSPPKEESRKSMGILSKTPIVGYLGFIGEYKGLEFLLEAMVNVPKVALLIGGGWHVSEETQYSVQLKEWTLRALPGRCQWLGYVDDEHLRTVYASMDLVVYPSMYATESGALIMALSHGKAVITSNIPPFKEKEKVGALTTFKNIDDLARKIKQLLKNKDKRRALEEGALKYCRSVSWNEIAKRHIALYEELCG